MHISLSDSFNDYIELMNELLSLDEKPPLGRRTIEYL
jgi:hypothetical protein